ncbi:MAG: chromate transporter [Oscillospiraceae bacterium]|nr:chromate transporter [Oscillospiraceae bacterium]
MVIDFLNYIWVMLLAGAGSFGGGPGGVNIIKEFAVNSWAFSEDSTGVVMGEILNVTTFSQYGGYSQGITLAAYLGAKTPLGVFGAAIGILAFVLPSILIVAVILKIGEKLYKSELFKHSLNYINLFAAGLICMLLWNYTITIFNLDLTYPLLAALACFLNIYFNISPALLLLGGALVGVIWRA